MWFTIRRRSMTFAFFAGSSFLPFAIPLHANTITVNDASSGSVVGKCTLQDAVTAANTNAAVNGCAAGAVGADTIKFAAGITSITLTAAASTPTKPNCAAALPVTEDVTFDGGAPSAGGAPAVTIARSSAAGTPAFSLIDAFPGSCADAATAPQVTVFGLTLRGGDASAKSSYADGGAIAASGQTIVRNSVIDGNHARSGGGIYVGNGIPSAAPLVVLYSTISNNTPNGINTDGAVSLLISYSAVTGNAVGIAAPYVKATNVTISGNTGDGVETSFFDLRFTTIANNQGNGLYLQNGFSSVTVHHLTDSVIAANAGFPYYDFKSISSTTVDTLDASQPTSYIGTMNGAAQSDIGSGVLIQSCAKIGLAPLANNGGSTQTQALQTGSCLIDAGSLSNPFVDDVFLATDQRGNGYARFVGLSGATFDATKPADIGAFECQDTTECPAAVSRVDGACGGDNGKTALLAAPTDLCSAGTPSAVSGSGHPWSWTCTGSGGGTTATCSATIKTWTVSAAGNSGGAALPASQSVDNGATAQVTGNPASGHAVSTAIGCGGSLNGNVYTTAAVTADCTVNFTFAATAKLVPSVSLNSSANPGGAGQAITFTATVSGAGAMPGGTISFMDGAAVLASIAPHPQRADAAISAIGLNAAGQASFTTAALAPGAHAITAVYSGDTNYAGATSNTVNETINAIIVAAPVGAPALSPAALALLGGLLAVGVAAARHRTI